MTGRRALPLAAGALTALALGLSAPRYVDHWDEVQMALGVLDFDLGRHHPHPPGYPGVVLLGRALRPLTGDALEALRWLSALAMGGWAALVVSRLSTELTRVARLILVVACIIWPLASPLLRPLGHAGLSYAAEAFAWLALALTLRSGAGPLVGAAAGLSGALRPTLALWALALCVLQRPRRPWAFFAGWALGVASGAALLLGLSGGPEAWWEASAPVLENIRGRALWRSAAEGWLTRAAMPGHLALALGPLVLLSPALARAGRGHDSLIHASALAFTFYALLIYDTPSYLAAPASTLMAWLLLQASAHVAALPPARQAGRALLVLGLTLGAALGPAAWLTPRLTPPPGPEHDTFIEDILHAIPEEGHALILTSTPTWRLGLRHLGWHAPEATVLQLARDPAFTITSDAQPFLRMSQRQLDAVGPASGPAAALAVEPPQHLLWLATSPGEAPPPCAQPTSSPWVWRLPLTLRLKQGAPRCP